MKRRVELGLVIAFLVCPAQALTFGEQDSFLNEVEAALAGGRLIQAERMLQRAKPGPDDLYRLSLIKADLAMAKGAYPEAISLYAALANEQPRDVRAMTGAGLAALKLGRFEDAHGWLASATALDNGDWRAWNGLGIASDHKHDWAASARAYQMAAALAPAEAAIWNNWGYSLLCQKRPMDAVDMLGKAARLAPSDTKIRVNLDLANASAGLYPERKKPAETTAQWASRLNNAGYSALLAGDKASARRLLSAAIKASEVRFDRAEANLQLVENNQ